MKTYGIYAMGFRRVSFFFADLPLMWRKNEKKQPWKVFSKLFVNEFSESTQCATGVPHENDVVIALVLPRTAIVITVEQQERAIDVCFLYSK